MKTRLPVLFMQSQTYFGSDSVMHALIMRNLDRSTIEVHVACNRASDPRNGPSPLPVLHQIPGLHVREMAFGPTLDRRTGWSLRQDVPSIISGVGGLASLAWYIRRNKIRIIHCTEKPRDAFYGLLLARLTGARCVIHLHVKYESWISPLVRWAMRRADAIVGVSRFVAESVVAAGQDPAKVHWVLNSIDAADWDPRTDGSSVRQQYDISPDVPVVSIMSRLFKWKGHTELLHALALVKERGVDFKLLLVGEDDTRTTPGKGPYSEELKALTRELGLTDYVIFTGYRSDIARLFAASDVFVMPSFEEPFGLVYLEAMAMSRPVVAAASGGAVEVIEDGVTGFLSPRGDIPALADNISRLLLDPTLRQAMGTAGRRRVEQDFTPRRMARDVEVVYEQVLSPKRARDGAIARQPVGASRTL